ncbi:MAG: thioredoxin [SAR324 cluster bacterium]|nr:thioredoxin [SAR324 cluster bacterium]
MSELIKHIGDQDFEEIVLKNDKPVLVDFWAEWCGPCRAIAPLLNTLAEENSEVIFTKINIDQHNKKAATAGVRGIPTLILYKEGKEVDRVVGADMNAIQSLVKSATSS